MKKHTIIVTILLIFVILVGCQTTHTASTLITDKNAVNHSFIDSYITNKFAEYGYGIDPNEQINLYQDNESQWTIIQRASNNTENKITVKWDGQSEIAETTFIQVENKVVYKR